MTQKKIPRKGRREILSALTEEAGKIVPVEDGDICIFLKVSSEFETFSGDMDRSLIQRFRDYLEEGIVDWIFEQLRPSVIEDLEYVTNDPATDERNFVIVPFMLNGVRRGLLLLYTAKPKKDFTSNDLDGLTALAESAARKIRGLFA